MILSLEELVSRLAAQTDPNDTSPSDALWVKFDNTKTHKTVEYQTARGNELLHVHLDGNGALVGVEIFS